MILSLYCHCTRTENGYKGTIKWWQPAENYSISMAKDIYELRR